MTPDVTSFPHAFKKDRMWVTAGWTVGSKPVSQNDVFSIRPKYIVQTVPIQSNAFIQHSKIRVNSLFNT